MELKEAIRVLKEEYIPDELFGTNGRESIKIVLQELEKLEEENKILQTNGFRQGLYEKDCGYIPQKKIEDRLRKIENSIKEAERLKNCKTKIDLLEKLDCQRQILLGLLED